jgi:hypothetical protein
MLIDLEHLHHWMQAIRQSPDPMRTMDAFWKGQLNSKVWLIEHLDPYIKDSVSIDIYGGWVGVLASMLFQKVNQIKFIRSIDIDPTCEKIAIEMNKLEEIQGKFSAITSNMCEINSTADIIINTSCEHISQAQYNLWIEKVSQKSLLVLQSNNYQIEEHIRTTSSLDEFKTQSRINCIWSGELELPLYKRYMLIGYKNV